MRLVFLDRSTVGNDIDVSVFNKYGKLTIYDYTESKEVHERISGCDIVITNSKAIMNEETLKGIPVKLICLTATGIDNVDLDYCRRSGIAVCNIKGYSTASVVQHTFALLFALWERMHEFSAHTRGGNYIDDRKFSHYRYTFREMAGKKFGIIGLGAIGSEVARIADALGFDVYYWSSSGEDRSSQYTRLQLNEILSICDVISINSPLTEKTFGLLGRSEFSMMKPDSFLINTGRGAIIVEEDLADAIEKNTIGGAGIDVLSKEPMAADCPFARILGRSNFIMTPHVAWAAVESRQRCIHEICLNIDSWIDGGTRNRMEI